ncbi:hypothetical protein ACFHYQ_12315 [Sphaerimonospora cavernae]|uniref:Potassium/proton antiporter subunit KhtT-like N-terminal domain-containing protein n=1 Tax=Sphaerimonospora cavernae TaxID=1740611 RepID=A0ABV6U3Q3_9ACTN
MRVSRTAVPGTGTVHHCVTRGGQRFGVLSDRTGRYRLLVYTAESDEPLQSIVLEQDEADHLAEILHSRPIADRVAVLERRVAEIAETAGTAS